MAKLTDKQRKQIISDYIELGSYRAVARKHGLNPGTIKRICDSDTEIKQKATQKKEQNTADILEGLSEQSSKVKQICAAGLDRLMEIIPESNNPRDIATAMGIIIDKYTAIAPKKQDETGRPYELPARVIAPSFAAVFQALIDDVYTEYVLGGGRGSTKSSFISLVIIWLMKNNPEFHALCVRKVGNTLRDSVYAQILWAISTLGLENEFDSKVSPMEITRRSTGQKIYFRGADDPIKLKSIKPPFGYIGVLWLEELDQFSGEDETRNIRQSVLRGGEKAYLIKSYNPPKSMSNWVNKAQQIPKPGRLLHKSTYLDVPAK